MLFSPRRRENSASIFRRACNARSLLRIRRRSSSSTRWARCEISSLDQGVWAVACFPAQFAGENQDPVPKRLFRPGTTGSQLFEQALTSTHDNLGGGRGGRCAVICDEIRNSEVCFVADRRDHRNRRSADGPCNGLFVEAPKVFERAAASSEYQNLCPRVPAEILDTFANLLDRILALYCRRKQADVQTREPPAEHVQYVPQYSAGRRRYERYSGRKARQRALSCWMEKPFGSPALVFSCSKAT